MTLLPALVMVEALRFLPADSLRCVALVNKGCQALVRHERRAAVRKQRQRTCSTGPWETIHDQIGGLKSVAGCLLSSLQLHISEATCQEDAASNGGSRRLSALSLPGMTDPLDDISVEWGSHFPGTPIGAACAEWLHRDVKPFTCASGSHGRWYLGVAHSVGGQSEVHQHSDGAMVIVSCGLVVFSHSGSVFSFALSFLVAPDRIADLYWHYNLGPDDVCFLRRQRTTSTATSVSAGDESLISSHPQLFCHWFTHERDARRVANQRIDNEVENGASAPHAKSGDDVVGVATEDKVPMSEVTPLSLLASSILPDGEGERNEHGPQHRSCVRQVRQVRQAVMQCMALCDTSSSDAVFVQRIEVAYLNRISLLVSQLQGSVFTIEEEFAEMVTPKGVWTYPTGLVVKHLVDAQRTWMHRHDRLVANLRRSTAKGSREMFNSGWVPVGLLISIL